MNDTTTSGKLSLSNTIYKTPINIESSLKKQKEGRSVVSVVCVKGLFNEQRKDIISFRFIQYIKPF